MRLRSVRWAPLVLAAAGRSLAYQVTRPWRRLDKAPSAPVAAAPPDPPPPATIARAVRIATLLPPLRGTCLSRSLTLCHLLRRNGYDASAVIGVEREGASAERKRLAHAWVELPGEAGENRDGRYAELIRLRP